MQHAQKSHDQLGKCLVSVLALMTFCIIADSAVAARDSTADAMPVKEVTVFKDGHAFVLHEGEIATNDQGDVVLDYLPRPIIGTFWSYSADSKAKLSAVVSGRHVTEAKKTALTIPELIRANTGAKVRITEAGKSPYDAVILEIPTRRSEELRRSTPPGTEQSLC